jgi:6-phosphofructokinase 2
VVSGGFPQGTHEAALSADIARLAGSIGARLILETSRAMRHAPERGTYLMKPSSSELAHMVGYPLETRAEQIAAARTIVDQGRSEIVVVSLGGEGAFVVTGSGVEHFQAPDVPPASAVGAGDSMVGAMVFALDQGWSLSEAVRFGVAAGTATIMTPGTELCHPDDVMRLFTATRTVPEAVN